jgi:hypothetical protein
MMKTTHVPAAIAAALSLAAFIPAAQAQSSDLQALKAQLEALRRKWQSSAKQQPRRRRRRTVRSMRRAGAHGGQGERLLAHHWKGDFRYRHENVDAEEAADGSDPPAHPRPLGFAAQVNDNTVRSQAGRPVVVTTTRVLPTRRSAAAGSARPGDRSRLYVDWKALSGLSVQLGKMPMPWQRVGSFVWDGDITPEGASVRYSQGAFFGSAFGYSLSERSTASDATLTGAQLGMTGNVGAAKLTGAVGYFDVGAVRGKVTATPTGCGTSFNNAFFGGAQGNTTVTVAGCPRLVNDFNMIEALAQAEFKVGALPLVVFADCRTRGRRA